MNNTESANEKSTGRRAQPTDYYIDVDGVGRFRMARRTMRDEFQIGAEYSRLTEGVDTPTAWLAQMSTIMATLKVLSVTVPQNWDIEALDPLDDQSYANMLAVYRELRVKEDSFRGIKTVQDGREAVSTNDSVLVPKEVSAPAE